MLSQVIDVIHPTIGQTVVSPSDQLLYSARLARETAKTAIDKIKESAEKAAQLSTCGKVSKAAWVIGFTSYTVADDIPAGILYSTVEAAQGRSAAIATLGIASTCLANGLATIQRRRLEADANREGEALVEKDRKLGVDLLSTYGVGSPATVATYPDGTIPTSRRTRVMSAFYGFGAQAGSYAGIESGAALVGFDPRLTLAATIAGVVSHGYTKETTNDFEAMARVMSLEDYGTSLEDQDQNRGQEQNAKIYYLEPKVANF